MNSISAISLDEIKIIVDKLDVKPTGLALGYLYSSEEIFYYHTYFLIEMTRIFYKNYRNGDKTFKGDFSLAELTKILGPKTKSLINKFKVNKEYFECYSSKLNAINAMRNTLTSKINNIDTPKDDIIYTIEFTMMGIPFGMTLMCQVDNIQYEF